MSMVTGKEEREREGIEVMEERKKGKKQEREGGRIER